MQLYKNNVIHTDETLLHLASFTCHYDSETHRAVACVHHLFFFSLLCSIPLHQDETCHMCCSGARGVRGPALSH